MMCHDRSIRSLLDSPEVAHAVDAGKTSTPREAEMRDGAPVKSPPAVQDPPEDGLGLCKEAGGAPHIALTGRMQALLSDAERSRLELICASPLVIEMILRQIGEASQRAGLAGFEVVHAGAFRLRRDEEYRY